jgi:pimeloyl-ACP methyl ester carboxylesterase
MKLIIAFLILVSGNVLAQKQLPYGFRHFTLKDKEIGVVDFYVKGEGVNKPLLLYLDGSGAYPLFQKLKQGTASTVLLNLKKVTEKYCVALISKPGVPFYDTANVEVSENSQPVVPELYQKTLSLNWRAESANQVINYLAKKKMINKRRVVVFGFSEGAQVAPTLAAKNKYVTHLVCFGGNGLNHLFDPIVQTRQKMHAGQYTPTQAQHIVDSLMTTYKNIYADPQSTEKQWWGHTYKRWSSFDSGIPVERLLTLDIPIYWVNGGLDENPVLSSDYLKLAFIRAGKDNLTHRIYPTYDHQLNEHIIQEGKEPQLVPRYKEVMDEAFAWVEKAKD